MWEFSCILSANIDMIRQHKAPKKAFKCSKIDVFGVSSSISSDMYMWIIVYPLNCKVHAFDPPIDYMVLNMWVFNIGNNMLEIHKISAIGKMHLVRFWIYEGHFVNLCYSKWMIYFSSHICWYLQNWFGESYFYVLLHVCRCSEFNPVFKH